MKGSARPVSTVLARPVDREHGTGGANGTTFTLASGNGRVAITWNKDASDREDTLDSLFQARRPEDRRPGRRTAEVEELRRAL